MGNGWNSCRRHSNSFITRWKQLSVTWICTRKYVESLFYFMQFFFCGMNTQVLNEMPRENGKRENRSDLQFIHSDENIMVDPTTHRAPWIKVCKLYEQKRTDDDNVKHLVDRKLELIGVLQNNLGKNHLHTTNARIQTTKLLCNRIKIPLKRKFNLKFCVYRFLCNRCTFNRWMGRFKLFIQCTQVTELKSVLSIFLLLVRHWVQKGKITQHLKMPFTMGEWTVWRSFCLALHGRWRSSSFFSLYFYSFPFSLSLTLFFSFFPLSQRSILSALNDSHTWKSFILFKY